MAINRDGEFEGDNLEKPLTIQKKICHVVIFWEIKPI